MINSIMEEGERKTLSKIPDSQSQTSTIYSSAANGKPADSARKAGHGAGNSGVGASEGFADIASKIFSSKVKGQVTSKMDTCDRKHNKQNGCDDDLPLGSEAHSLSLDHGTDRKYPPPEDTRSKWRRATSQGIMGWQSFNSDVSNQTSASSASLEQLLNDRQVDPEQMLMSLGFGGEHQNAVPTLARVPARFLHHPSRAYGIIPPGCTEEEEEEEEEDVVDDTGAAVHVPDKSSTSAANNTTSSTTSSSAVVPHNRKRSGIWTLARTLSLLRMRTTPSRGHMSPTSNSSGTQPLTNHPVSILHPANQQYLAKVFMRSRVGPRVRLLSLMVILFMLSRKK
uniref:ITPR-interacting domain-containing protein n=1 Tax=Arion vulgaris TaxID=1028688 RepID=A0A0B7B4Q4_9EUPU